MRIYLPDDLSLHKTFLLGRAHKKRIIRVMRLRAGDTLDVFTPGKHWICKILEIHPDGLKLEPVEEKAIVELPGPKICLAQALIRSEKFEWFIQKATELGVNEIIPLITQRTLIRPAHREDKLIRWNEIAAHAAGQSENSNPPTIHLPRNLTTFLQTLIPGNLLLLRERNRSGSLKETLRGLKGNITVVVGPEGGWAEEELQLLRDAGFQDVSLGRRILRAETAGLAMIAILQYEFGDSG